MNSKDAFHSDAETSSHYNLRQRDKHKRRCPDKWQHNQRHEAHQTVLVRESPVFPIMDESSNFSERTPPSSPPPPLKGRLFSLPPTILPYETWKKDLSKFNVLYWSKLVAYIYGWFSTFMTKNCQDLTKIGRKIAIFKIRDSKTCKFFSTILKLVRC